LVLSEWRILTTGGKNDNEEFLGSKEEERELSTDSIENSTIKGLNKA
jgi:hypothetical protein